MEDLKSKFTIEYKKNGFDFLFNGVPLIEINTYVSKKHPFGIGKNVSSKVEVHFINKSTGNILLKEIYEDKDIFKSISNNPYIDGNIYISHYFDKLKNFCFKKCIEILINLLEDMKKK